MPFKWTDAQTRQANIVDTETFDKAYNSVKGVINGGLDRENLPNASVADVHLSPKAFLKYALKQNIRLQSATALSIPVSGGAVSSQNYIAIGYNAYAGGWKTNTAQGLTSLFKEGMLHVEFNCWYWLSNLGVLATLLRREATVEFQVLLDGSPIMTSGTFWKNVGQVHLVGDFPVSTGSHTLEVAWRMTSRNGRPNTDAMFYYDGGAMLAINRIR
jgi:hypothetical protein